MNREIIQPGKTIGIIGGGQLGRMMALAAKEAGFRIIVLDPTNDCPCGQVADEQITAGYDDLQALEHLAKKCDVITFEFENIDYESLLSLSRIANVPQGAEIIRITQDRIIEKNTLVASGVKVAPFKVIHSEAEMNKAIQELGFPCVLKTSRGGYDGKGQHVIQCADDSIEAKKLLEYGACVLESWVEFEKEISVIVTRNVNGDMECFPVGENIHVDNILHQTIVPAHINKHIEVAAFQLAEKIAEHIELIGTLAVEMFLTADGQIFVNELAPRPHNSGHYSIEACDFSQFDQHIRAICNWPLKSPSLLKPVVMVNILGQHVEKLMEQIPLQSEWSIHLYGKSQSKYQRKMGHITVLTDNIERTLSQLNDSGIWK
ncbi:5-(carboxyamino)imidazole ribonucleotide synthase [Heyndrickxia sporothermodurans]|uniref:N5-carboxyaminoimidazole ribonucleotide synthase n=1 Tax=Heyndrickxia sporothermodurans TaxID=46224 RepID=A0AB37HFY7_9BACI|nr:5-(carboxyamino)imidazole ribonucleotide synthase [Heyndrickxia sporothermodurans]MBL5766785.1 5-(carboxyamino)imidazole ribonucleotide synthase [Heyndrickxia sporothermodurans]MBL5770413.1 5-(carboxyamino)imidazole ribonucleotide synthase [Heyndrickxia sporothermodurans]MBL5773963.1 5-(carboxyamino)imidazole ribonucleotide synthase [Heyndrickxia sporothermodurans]MBL5777475.1 5-(carboxyamino)imidazole ribonucleotide synthase [Heyndrickxia sporothermodurans]MBL5780986.1 5-(carboxyamino)imid